MPHEILITGATGFVGRHLAPILEQKGYAVRGLSRKDGDLASMALDFPGVEHVFHLAGRTFVPESWTTPKPFYELNVIGTLNILEFCKRQRASITIVSSYVYGIPERLPIREDHVVKALNPYGQSKIMAEELAQFYRCHSGLPLSIVRPFNLYGSGQDSRFLIPTLIRQFLDPAVVEVQVADLRPRRDYLHVEDFVQMLVRILETGRHGVFNAGFGTSVSVEEIARMVRIASGHTTKPLVSRNEERTHEVMDVVADITKAREELHWAPQISLEQGIGHMVRSSQRELQI
jgi:nucleoside-diphosphate-sugar epimerase